MLLERVSLCMNTIFSYWSETHFISRKMWWIGKSHDRKKANPNQAIKKYLSLNDFDKRSHVSYQFASNFHLSQKDIRIMHLRTHKSWTTNDCFRTMIKMWNKTKNHKSPLPPFFPLNLSRWHWPWTGIAKQLAKIYAFTQQCQSRTHKNDVNKFDC